MRAGRRVGKGSSSEKGGPMNPPSCWRATYSAARGWPAPPCRWANPRSRLEPCWGEAPAAVHGRARTSTSGQVPGLERAETEIEGEKQGPRERPDDERHGESPRLARHLQNIPGGAGQVRMSVATKMLIVMSSARKRLNQRAPRVAVLPPAGRSPTGTVVLHSEPATEHRPATTYRAALPECTANMTRFLGWWGRARAVIQ
jgi:hypothetical protein